MIKSSGFLPQIDLFGVGIPTYFLFGSLALSVGVFWIWRRAGVFRLNPKIAMTHSLWGLLGVLIGARGFHVLIEDPAYYFEHPVRVFEIWRGGFTWHGGFLGGVLGLSGSIWRNRLATEPFGRELLSWLNLSAPVFAFGYAIGRLGCFFVGCCHGAICQWTSIDVHGHPVLLGLQLPSQGFAILAELGLGVYLLRKERRLAQDPMGLKRSGLFWIWLMGHGFNRIVMETLRDDPRGPLIPVIGPPSWMWQISLSPGMLFAIFAVLIGLWGRRTKSAN